MLSLVTAVLFIRPPRTMRVFKVGGLRFLRIGRLQFSFCMVRK